jgi:hypothetical protein
MKYVIVVPSVIITGVSVVKYCKCIIVIIKEAHFLLFVVVWQLKVKFKKQALIIITFSIDY